MQIRAISKVVSDLGEGPIWNPDTNEVTWVDITGKKVHQSQFDSGLTRTFELLTSPGCIVEKREGGYLAGTSEGFANISIDGELTPMHSFLDATMRFNDGKVDAAGRFWASSLALDFSADRGSLYVVDVDGTYRQVLNRLTLPNGLGWSPDSTSFYFIDSVPGVLKRFDFDVNTGEVSNPIVLINFDSGNGIPDGMTVSTNGFIVVAIWDGFRLEIYSPNGKKVEEIKLPIQRPTSCTFAGLDGTTLIVTSAAQDLDLIAQPLSGKILAISDTGLSGLPSRKFGLIT